MWNIFEFFTTVYEEFFIAKLSRDIREVEFSEKWAQKEMNDGECFLKFLL